MNEHLKEKTANQKIFEWMNPGECWHVFGGIRGDDWGNPRCFCKGCGQIYQIPAGGYPAYDSEDSPRQLLAEVEAKVIETFGAQRFGNAIYQQLREPFQLHPRDEFEMIVTIVATASASVRAAAIVALIQEKK